MEKNIVIMENVLSGGTSGMKVELVMVVSCVEENVGIVY
jgi:hypothetical protein